MNIRKKDVMIHTLNNNVQYTGNQNIATKGPRDSNLELYRIICMLMIVAHHYVVCSGLTSDEGPLMTDFPSLKCIFLTLFGAFGKTGINCFLMITGYFMCTSKITLRKFVKLMAQVYFFRFIFFLIFFVTGYETISAQRLVRIIMPFWGFSDGFVSCFIAFWLTIPFLSILVQNLSERQHQFLLLLALGLYTLLGSIPTFNITFNYITWFGIIFFIASYIRLHPQHVFNRQKLWGWLTLVSVLLSIGSVLGLRFIFNGTLLGYDFVSDSNKIFAVLVAVCSFLWFKNLKISYSKIINAFGAATFGVLLIHSNSAAMRTWLWKDTINCVEHYSLPTVNLILYCLGVVLAIFIICNLIDQLRIATVEKWFLKWYDYKIAPKADKFINKILQKQ